jgi:hypothetical protein
VFGALLSLGYASSSYAKSRLISLSPAGHLAGLFYSLKFYLDLPMIVFVRTQGGTMTNPISWILAKLLRLFSKLDTDTKEKIVDMIVEAFHGSFRSYFHQMREAENEDSKSTDHRAGLGGH